MHTYTYIYVNSHAKLHVIHKYKLREVLSNSVLTKKYGTIIFSPTNYYSYMV